MPAVTAVAPPRPAGRRLLSGVVPPIVTPFLADLTVDHDALAALCRYQIDAGVDGLYPCGTTGEFALLTADERRAVAETVVTAAAGNVPVYIQVGATTTAETIILARHAAACGADGVAVITPYYYAYDDEALRRHYLTVAEAIAPLPLYLYNLPARAGNAISPALAGQLFAEAPNIVGMKDSGGNADTLRQFRALGRQSILSGADGMNLLALRMGCDGMIPGNANADPAPFVSLYRSWRGGDEAGAVAGQARIDAVRRHMAGRAGIANFKAVLVARGVLRTAAVRPPLAPSTVDGAALLARLQQSGSTAH